MKKRKRRKKGERGGTYEMWINKLFKMLDSKLDEKTTTNSPKP